MRILGIDPGPESSGVCVYDAVGRKALWSAEHLNYPLVAVGIPIDFEVVVIENLVPYKFKPTAAVMDTLRWVGRFEQAFSVRRVVLLTRPEILSIICGTANASKGEANEAVRRLHGGWDSSVGKVTKKVNAPGPLFGVKGHAWDALAAAVAYAKSRDFLEVS